jgi:hypothetical protein
MKPRITFCLTPEGTLDIFLNEEGRRQLISELSRLNEQHEHFHFAPHGIESELSVSSVPYGPGDKALEYGKVLFRTDEWDKQYFPHVITDRP